MTPDADWQARVDLAAAHRLAVHFGYNEGIDNHFTLLVGNPRVRFPRRRFCRKQAGG